MSPRFPNSKSFETIQPEPTPQTAVAPGIDADARRLSKRNAEAIQVALRKPLKKLRLSLNYLRTDVANGQELYERVDGEMIYKVAAKYVQPADVEVTNLEGSDPGTGFTVRKNGFTLVPLLGQQSILESQEQRDAIRDMGANFGWSPERENIVRGIAAQTVRCMLTAGSSGRYGEGVAFDALIPVDAVFRDTAPKSKFRSVPLVHYDFPPESTLAKLMQVFGDMWYRNLMKIDEFRQRAVEHFAVSADDDATLKQLMWEDAQGEQAFWSRWEMVDTLNVWIALVEGGVERDPLLMMDKQSYEESDVCTYTAQRRPLPGKAQDTAQAAFPRGDKFPAVAFRSRPGHQWYFRNGMRLGEAWVFQTRVCPHSAASWTARPDAGYRRSVESRVLVLKWNVECTPNL